MYGVCTLLNLLLLFFLPAIIELIVDTRKVFREIFSNWKIEILCVEQHYYNVLCLLLFLEYSSSNCSEAKRITFIYLSMYYTFYKVSRVSRYIDISSQFGLLVWRSLLLLFYSYKELYTTNTIESYCYFCFCCFLHKFGFVYINHIRNTHWHVQMMRMLLFRFLVTV